jgi:hypothetical protein
VSFPAPAAIVSVPPDIDPVIARTGGDGIDARPSQ